MPQGVTAQSIVSGFDLTIARGCRWENRVFAANRGRGGTEGGGGAGPIGWEEPLAEQQVLGGIARDKDFLVDADRIDRGPRAAHRYQPLDADRLRVCLLVKA